MTFYSYNLRGLGRDKFVPFARYPHKICVPNPIPLPMTRVGFLTTTIYTQSSRITKTPKATMPFDFTPSNPNSSGKTLEKYRKPGYLARTRPPSAPAPGERECRQDDDWKEEAHTSGWFDQPADENLDLLALSTSIPTRVRSFWSC